MVRAGDMYTHTQGPSDVNMRNMRKMFLPLPASRRCEVRRALPLVHFLLLSPGFTPSQPPSPRLYLPHHTHTHTTAGPYTYACTGSEEEAWMSTMMKNEFSSTPFALKGPVRNLLGSVRVNSHRKCMCLFCSYANAQKLLAVVFSIQWLKCRAAGKVFYCTAGEDNMRDVRRRLTPL